MAYLLEKDGYKNINLLLIDTILYDKHMKLILNKLFSNDEYKNQLKETMCKNYDKEYADKVLSAIEAEKSLISDPLSGKLWYSNVTLLKAIQVDDEVENICYKKLIEYGVYLNTNGISPYSDNLTIYELDCNHNNILDYLDISEFLRM